ncbi:Peptidoglycan O-acetyltransferase [compost metagenome]
MQGFIKKVFIADTLAPLVAHCFALENPSAADAWLGTLAYTAQLYFDFSGYSDMAIGLGLMMGFRFLENFKQPYISQSITEFWRRWHISLSTWLRDYLYVSLGGNRGGTFATYRNLMLTMLLGGLWHGANFTFVLWGAWHGLWLAIERARGVDAAPRRFNPLKWAVAFLVVILGWVLFRSENLDVAARMYQAMFGFSGWQLSELGRAGLTDLQVVTLGIAFASLAFFGLHDFYSKPLAHAAPRAAADEPAGAAMPVAAGAHRGERLLAWSATLQRPLLLLLFCASVLKLSAQSYSPFLYFQF